jgi:hypothetical protein
VHKSTSAKNFERESKSAKFKVPKKNATAQMRKVSPGSATAHLTQLGRKPKPANETEAANLSWTLIG